MISTITTVAVFLFLYSVFVLAFLLNADSAHGLLVLWPLSFYFAALKERTAEFRGLSCFCMGKPSPRETR